MGQITNVRVGWMRCRGSNRIQDKMDGDWEIDGRGEFEALTFGL
jgi:hypothetical protein